MNTYVYVFVRKYAALTYLCCCDIICQTHNFYKKMNDLCRSLKDGKAKIKRLSGLVSGKGPSLSFQYYSVLKLSTQRGQIGCLYMVEVKEMKKSKLLNHELLCKDASHLLKATLLIAVSEIQFQQKFQRRYFKLQLTLHPLSLRVEWCVQVLKELIVSSTSYSGEFATNNTFIYDHLGFYYPSYYVLVSQEFHLNSPHG